MNKIISFTILFITICSSQAYALTPEESIRAIANELKSTRKISSLVKHVDWDFAYNQLSDDDKKHSGFKSASSMQSFYASKLEQNGSGVISMMKKATIEQSENGGKYDPSRLNSVNSLYEKLKLEHDKDITAMSFEISPAKISNDKKSAMIVVKRNLNGQTMTKRIRMKKSGDKWLASSAEIFNPIKPVYSSPVGGTLNPLMAIHNL